MFFKKYNIDLSKISRDYLKYPLLKGNRHNRKPEIIPKKDLEYLYLTLNFRLNDLIEYFNYNECSILKLLKEYNIKKDKKLMLQNLKETKLERYGDENYNNFEKYKQTCLEKYGDEIPMKTIQVKNNLNDVMIKKYGEKRYTQTNEYKEKMKETCLKKYGKEHYMKTEIYKNKYKNPNFQSIKLRKEIETKRKNGTLGKSISKKETEWLNSLNIPNDKEHRQVIIIIDDKQYIVDGYDPESNTIYEFLGDYWHGNPKTTIQENINHQRNKSFGDLYKDTINKIEKLKTKYNVIYIWESDYKD